MTYAAAACVAVAVNQVSAGCDKQPESTESNWQEEGPQLTQKWQRA